MKERERQKRPISKKQKEEKEPKKKDFGNFLTPFDTVATLPKLLDERGELIRGGRELYFGRSGSGKTSLLFERFAKNFPLEHNKRFYYFLVMPSFETNRAWEGHENVRKYFEYPNGEAIHELDERSLRGVRAALKTVIGKHKRQPVLILDDQGDNTAVKLSGSKKNIVQDLAKQASHFPVIIIGLFQKVTQASPTFRENVDNVTIFKYDDDKELKQVHSSYFGGYKYDDFKERFLTILKDPYDHLTIKFESGGRKLLIKNEKEEINL